MEDEPGDISWFALEEIWHEDLVLLFIVRRSQDISTLNRLREVSEDVIDIKDGFGSAGRASNVWHFHVS